MKRQHKHAQYIIAWANGEEVEFLDECFLDECSDHWADVGESHYWNPDRKYRFKPKMIRCGDLEFPEPIRVAPEVDELVWLTTLVRPELVQWSDNQIKDYWLKLGLIHATKESAEAHARALVALTEVKP